MSSNPELQILIIGDCRISNQLFDYLENQKATVVKCLDIDTLERVHYDVVIINSSDQLEIKVRHVQTVVDRSNNRPLICINLDAINLAEIQQIVPNKILGLNFSYPFSDSKFMEIIRTEMNDDSQVQSLVNLGKNLLNKDPYVVNRGVSARALMLAAMTREAFYLVDNGYANIASIDRACRNDAGYYMPFTGNFLYMDLMGTIAYALVMRDLNPELANSDELPPWFLQKVNAGNTGMVALDGLYTYQEGDYEKWDKIILEFSNDVSQLIKKYDQQYVNKMQP